MVKRIKKQKTKKILKVKGITLIALIVTITVLLILAGIAIAELKKNNLLNGAKTAKQKYESSQVDENTKIDDYANMIDTQQNGGTPTAEDISFTPSDSNWKVKNVKEALDYLYNN